MKAAKMVGPRDLQIKNVLEPQPVEQTLLLRVEMVGLCGSDLNSYRGSNPLVTYPRIPGHEIAATVIEGSKNIPAGTRVTVSPYTSCGHCASCRRGRVNACQSNQTLGVQRDGALTELIRLPESKLFPSKLSLRELCFVEPLTVGIHAVSRADITSSDTVAVFGCGGVGLGAIAGSAFRGARTIAIDMDNEKLATARAAGASDTIHAQSGDLHQRLQEITNGSGPDIVIEAIGLPETFRAAVEEVAFTGTVVYIGYAKQPVTYETKLFVQKELNILGSRNALDKDFEEAIAMLEAGRFPVDRAISAIIGMEELPDMMEAWSQNPALYTKIMVNVGD